MRKATWMLAAAALFVASGAAAVTLDGNNRCTVKLSDGTDVELIGEFISKIGKRGVDGEEEATRPLTPLPSLASRAVPEAAGAVKVASRAVGDRAKEVDEEFEAKKEKALEGPSYKWAEQEKSDRFHYLPPASALRLARRRDGTPDFLFVKYTTEEKGGAQGGIFHVIMELSLTPRQEAELKMKARVACRDKDAGIDDPKVIGAVEIEETEKDGFRIISATLTDETMTRSLIQSGHAPNYGGRIAAAGSLTKDGAQLFLATVEKSRSIADLSIELNYKYAVMLPAAKGSIIFHWDRLQEMQETFEANYHKEKQDDHWGGCFFASDCDTDVTYSETEVSSMFDLMVENSVVEFLFEGYDPDSEYTQKIMEAMLQYFMNSMMEPADQASMEMAPREEGAGPERPELHDGEGTQDYTVNHEKMSRSFAVKKQEIRLDAGFGVWRNHNVVANMAEWYNSVRDNRKCVQEVNLNDPFFEHREVRFIIDLEAKEIFEGMVNYVTVNVKKRRAKGNDFNQSLTIDHKYLSENGVVASMTYAREGSRNSEVYMYQTQWSLKGGNLFPANPSWQRGKWEGVTLAPPIERWYVEVEGDLDQMEQNNIARVTVELHYPLFGEEKFTVMPLSPRGGEFLLAENIYVDRGTRGFAYRLIVHHKTEGRMALPWQTRIGDRYVYATIPEEILAEGSAREVAKLAAKKLGKMGAEKVLNKFQELFAAAD